MISTNKDLTAAVEQVIKDNGVKKTWIAERLGVANQNVNKLMRKSNFSIDDANRILSLFGYEATVSIVKKK